MKKEVKVTELSHDELVDIFSTAFTGNNDVFIDWDDADEEEVRKLVDLSDACIEDILAELVLHGKRIDIVDYEQCESGSVDGVTLYGDRNLGRWVPRSEFPDHYYRLMRGVDFAAVYSIGLEDILAAGSTPEGYEYLHTMLDDLGGDFYDGWNFMQIAMFGEVIYG